MLQVKSFKFNDDEGINNLLIEFRVAQGASIFVSNGEICIPFEDGEPENIAQKLIGLKEDKNVLVKKRDVLIRGQEVLMRKVKGLTEQINEVEANLSEIKKTGGKESYEDKRTNEERLKELQNVLDQVNKSIINNQAQVTEYTLEINVIDDLLK